MLGHFGTKEALQLAALERASAMFSRMVWEPVADARPGLTRLRAVCESWIGYLEHERDAFPGGWAADTDPEQATFELMGFYLALNQAIQLHADSSAPARTRRALDRLLAPATW